MESYIQSKTLGSFSVNSAELDYFVPETKGSDGKKRKKSELVTSCKTSESLKQQRLNQLIGQVVLTEEKTEEGDTVPSDKSQPTEKQQEGTVMTGAAQQSAKICHSNKPANLQGDDARRGGRFSTCDCIKEAAGRSRLWTRGETKDYGYEVALWWRSVGAPAAVVVTGTQLIVQELMIQLFL